VRAKTAYLDGELCGVGDDGLPSFSQTQAASDGSRGVRLVYFVFDLLHLDGRDIASLAPHRAQGAAGVFASTVKWAAANQLQREAPIDAIAISKVLGERPSTKRASRA
jgi:ATP-dependent DNA ligase